MYLKVRFSASDLEIDRTMGSREGRQGPGARRPASNTSPHKGAGPSMPGSTAPLGWRTPEGRAECVLVR